MSEQIRVLHVDDEPDFAEMTATFLERENDRFDVETTTDADEALELLDDEDYDCVVSDHEMPGMTGIELLEVVRDGYPDIPFILFTGRGSEEVASEAISAGVTDYLQKGGTDKYTILANRTVNAVETARAKAAARRSQNRLQNLSEAFPDIAFYIDENGRYVEVIAGSESPLLYDEAEDLVGRRFHDILPSETADRFHSTVQKAIETGELQTIEYELDVQAGSRWFEARVVKLDTRLSDSRAVIWVARDITEHKEKKRELRRQNRRLDEFASIVSHDLRNPLSVAKGRLELVRENCDDEDVQHLDAIKNAHDRMETLIDDLLTLSRSGKPVEDVEPVSLKETTEVCWRNVETSEAVLMTPTDRRVMSNENRLQQLLENLIRNSVEHGGEDVTVTVDCFDDDTDGFYVADDGTGVPEDDREEVFESGYSTSEGGAGLGLSIVEGIAEAHDWEIDLTESRDGGARFEIIGVDLAE